MNTEAFLADHMRHFADSYAHFKAFGGPCVHFHIECLQAGRDGFLSVRHLEMLYATLTAWGLHRMGDEQKTKAKLTEWERFRDSILSQSSTLKQFQGLSMLQMPRLEYERTVLQMRAIYDSLDLSVSKSTVVVNSKALFHIFPDLIPPIDRQYTIRFFTQPSANWRSKSGKFRQIVLPAGPDAQFQLFKSMCVKIKELADRVNPIVFEEQRCRHNVAGPKAVDNAIVKYVRTTAAEMAGGPISHSGDDL